MSPSAKESVLRSSEAVSGCWHETVGSIIRTLGKQFSKVTTVCNMPVMSICGNSLLCSPEVVSMSAPDQTTAETRFAKPMQKSLEDRKAIHISHIFTYLQHAGKP